MTTKDDYALLLYDLTVTIRGTKSESHLDWMAWVLHRCAAEMPIKLATCLLEDGCKKLDYNQVHSMSFDKDIGKTVESIQTSVQGKYMVGPDIIKGLHLPYTVDGTFPITLSTDKCIYGTIIAHCMIQIHEAGVSRKTAREEGFVDLQPILCVSLNTERALKIFKTRSYPKAEKDPECSPTEKGGILGWFISRLN